MVFNLQEFAQAQAILAIDHAKFKEEFIVKLTKGRAKAEEIVEDYKHKEDKKLCSHWRDFKFYH